MLSLCRTSPIQKSSLTTSKSTSSSLQLQQLNSNKTPNIHHIRYYASSSDDYHATTVLSVRKNGKVVLIADGQVSIGNVIAKSNAKKLRRMGHENQVAVGFAGSAADALALCDLLEKKIEEHRGQVLKACVEMAKNWRTDKYLRPLNAVMIVVNKDITLEISGNGDVLEPTDGLVGIGSGGSYALAAARALIDIPGMEAVDIAKKAMTIAADMCVYTNANFTIEVIDSSAPSSAAKKPEGENK